MSRRFLTFLVVGGMGFLVDSGITMGLIANGLSPFAARPPAILAAMLFTWLANRYVTFAVAPRESVGEAARYFGVGGAAALLNYGLYSMLLRLSAPLLVAIAAATATVAVVSYFGYKRIAFGIPLRH